MKQYPVTHASGGADKRYSVALEYCGAPGQRYVARFCDEWIGQSLDYPGAVLKAVCHNAIRNGALVIEEQRG